VLAGRTTDSSTSFSHQEHSGIKGFNNAQINLGPYEVPVSPHPSERVSRLTEAGRDDVNRFTRTRADADRPAGLDQLAILRMVRIWPMAR
jgi:hypothetical protein